MYIQFNPNPAGRHVGDCAVRALAAALGKSWEEAYTDICDAGYNMCDMPSSDAVWGAVLRQNGFYKKAISNYCPDCYTVDDFCHDNPIGTFVLGFGGHAATVIDGNLYDSWDSSKEIPTYVWYKKGA